MAPNYYKSPIGCGHNLVAVNLVAFCTILAHNTVITQYECTLVLIAVVLYVIIAQKFETLET